jgi:hypothetical protein
VPGDRDAGGGRRGEVTAVLCAAFDQATDEAILAVRELIRAAGVRCRHDRHTART